MDRSSDDAADSGRPRATVAARQPSDSGALTGTHFERRRPKSVLTLHGDCLRVAAGLEVLLEATQRLSESIDYRRTLANVVDFVAQRFASYAILDIVAPDGHIERVAVAHSDPARLALLECIRRFQPRRELASTHPVARAVARGEATLEAIDERWIEHAAIDLEHAQTMRDLHIRELLVVPVLARTGNIVGALTCALDAHATRPAFDENDLKFARELGRRAGLAIENARLYEREHRIAVELQAASLPLEMPKVDGLRIDANYRPGRDEATIGGDWYDAVEVSPGRVVFTIGDVVGSGLHAAVTMTKLRQAMQAAAMLSAEPTAILEVAERTLQLHDRGGYATALAAIYDIADRTLTIASAGHPPPLVLKPDGTFESCDVRGVMLGIAVGTTRVASAMTIAPGTSIVFYTDGLTEIDGDLETGERRLREAVTLENVMRSSRPARAIVDAVLGSSPHTDDIALMTCSVDGA